MNSPTLKINGFITFFLVIPFLGLTQQKEEKTYSPQLNHVRQSEVELGMKTGVNQNALRFIPPGVIGNSALEVDFGTGIANRFSLKIGSNEGFAFLSAPGYLQKRSKLIIPRDSTVTLTYNLEYISIPFYSIYQSDFQYLAGNVFQQFYFNSGISFNILTRARRKVEIEQLEFSQTRPFNKNVNPVEASGVLALGSRFLINQAGSFYVELKAESSLTDINNSFEIFSNLPSSAPDIKIRHFGVSFLVGFSTSLAKPNQNKNSLSR